MICKVARGVGCFWRTLREVQGSEFDNGRSLVNSMAQRSITASADRSWSQVNKSPGPITERVLVKIQSQLATPAQDTQLSASFDMTQTIFVRRQASHLDSDRNSIRSLLRWKKIFFQSARCLPKTEHSFISFCLSMNESWKSFQMVHIWRKTWVGLSCFIIRGWLQTFDELTIVLPTR